MYSHLDKAFLILLYLFPISFILGSALINIIVFLTLVVFFSKIIIVKDYYVFKTTYFKISIIFTLYYTLITYINNDLLHTWKAFFLIRYFLLPLIFHYFFSKIDFNKKKLLIYYFLILSITSIDLIIQKIFNVNILGFKPSLWNEAHQLNERYAGFFNQELIAGGYLVYLGIICFILFVSIFDYSKKNLIIFLFSFILVITGLFVTGDRAPVIILVSFIVLSIIFLKKARIFLIPSLLAMIIIFLTGVSISKNIKLRFIDYPVNRLTENLSKNLTFKKKTLNTFQSAIKNTPWGKHYRVAYEMILQTPFTGLGLKSFRKHCKKYNYILNETLIINKTEVLFTHNGCSTHPHNFILEILTDIGLIGLTLLLYVMFLSIRLALKSSSNPLYVLFFLMFILSVISPFKPSGSFFSTWTSTMIWFILSLMHLFVKKEEKKI